jgi:hypothetical protein
MKTGYGSFLYQLFSKRDFYFKKLPKIDFFRFFEKGSFLTVFVVRMSLMCVPRPEKRENSPNKFEVLPILPIFGCIL